MTEELRKPFAILDIGFPAGDVFHMPGIGQNHLNTAALQNFKRRHPVHPCGFHCHRFDANAHQPVSHSLKISGERLKRLHRLIRQTWCNRNNVESRADVDPGRSVIEYREPGLPAIAFLGHDRLL